MGESGEPSDVTSLDTSGDEAEMRLQIKDLLGKISEMEAAARQAREEFGFQRAKMKDLFLQKENELKAITTEKSRLQSELEELRRLSAVTDLKKNDLEFQRQKYEDQIASLEQLVHDAVEESSLSRSHLESEVKRLQAANERLEAEMSEYRKMAASSSDDRHVDKDKDRSSDPPPIQMLTQVTKTFARKVLSELGADSSSNSTKDSLEDSMRKAQEDAEVLRSLVVPLEEEIVALKEKLRETDEHLRRYTGKVPSFETSSKTPVDSETNIQNRQKVAEQESLLMLSPSTPQEPQSTILEPRVSPQDGAPGKDLEVFLSGNSGTVFNGPAAPSAAGSSGCNMCRNYEAGLQRAQQKTRELEKAIERGKEDLTREHAFRQEMEVKWNEKKEQHKLQVAELQKKTASAERALQELRQTYIQTYQDVTQQLSRLQHDRVAIKKEIDKLQAENDILVGKHSEHSENLQNQVINLPNSVEELQELLLQRHEELIAAKVCAETQQSEADLLRDELQIQQVQHAQLLQDLQQLKVLVHKNEADRKRIQVLEASERQALEQVEDLKIDLDKSHREKARLEESIKNLQGRIASLQHDLDVSEQVQKDFVRLSQSLQVQLEGFRQPDTQVRWQHEDDVEECPTCHINFGSSSSRKTNCKHCGRIFCNSCLSHKVPSGPQQRLSRVCDVCHTLLVPNTAPYFSNEPPPTPD